MRGREQNGRHTESKRLECVLEHIRVNLNEPPDYRRLAKLANISYCQLFREFKRCLGVSPQQYIEQQRIAYAKRLLAADRLSVKEVAFQSGYKNPLYFSRRFQKVTGMSPSAFRQSCLSNPEKISFDL